MRGNAVLSGLTRQDLTEHGDRVAIWLGQLGHDVPAPEGDHGQLVFTVTVEWDHIRPAP